MIFDDAYSMLAIGTRVRVSDGRKEPPGRGDDAHKAWRSHNHEGEIVSKDPGPPRTITVLLDEIEIEPGITTRPGYTLEEDDEHVFEDLSTDEAKLSAQQRGRRQRARERARLARMKPRHVLEEAETRMLTALRTLFPDLVITAAQIELLFPHARVDGGSNPQ